MKYSRLHPGFSQRAFSFLLLTALAVGAAPAFLVAQASENAATAAPASTQAPPDVKKSQEEQNNVFRLEGPIVKWTANTTHLSAETTATIFEFINFGAIVLLVGIPVARVMPKVIRKRVLTVKQNLESARAATEDAKIRLTAIESKLSGLDAEIAQIRSQVEQESLQDETRIKASLVEENARIVASAEQEIAVAAAHARRELQHFAANLAIDQAVKQLVLSPEADQALIAEFVRGVTKEGQN